jgi:DNA-binding SARP family transcriptional activator
MLLGIRRTLNLMLKISLLGPFAASLQGIAIRDFGSSKGQALLIYLAVESRQAHQREALMTLLWPDFTLQSAQQNLRQTLYTLRKALEPDFIAAE